MNRDLSICGQGLCSRGLTFPLSDGLSYPHDKVRSLLVRNFSFGPTGKVSRRSRKTPGRRDLTLISEVLYFPGDNPQHFSLLISGEKIREFHG